MDHPTQKETTIYCMSKNLKFFALCIFAYNRKKLDHPTPNRSNGSRAAARKSPTNPERPFENRKPPRFLQKILQKPRRYFVRPPAVNGSAGVGIVDSRLIVVSRRSRPSRRVVRNVCGSSRRRSRRGFGWE